jgi:hypothetical protein
LPDVLRGLGLQQFGHRTQGPAAARQFSVQRRMAAGADGLLRAQAAAAPHARQFWKASQARAAPSNSAETLMCHGHLVKAVFLYSFQKKANSRLLRLGARWRLLPPLGLPFRQGQGLNLLLFI